MGEHFWWKTFFGEETRILSQQTGNANLCRTGEMLPILLAQISGQEFEKGFELPRKKPTLGVQKHSPQGNAVHFPQKFEDALMFLGSKEEEML